MKQLKPFLLLFILAMTQTVLAQMKPQLEDQKIERNTPLQLEDVQNLSPLKADVPKANNSIFNTPSRQFQSIPNLVKPSAKHPTLKIIGSSKTGLPIVIKGSIEGLPESDIESQSFAYLEALKDVLKIENPSDEFEIISTNTDDLGQQHIRLQQKYQGIPVYGAEVILHQKNGELHLFNGRYFATPELENVTPSVAENTANQTVFQNLETKTKIKTLSELELSLINTPTLQSELVVYYKNNEPHLAWHFEVVPNIAARWAYFVDAHSGEILKSYNLICQFAGHISSNSEDLGEHRCSKYSCKNHNNSNSSPFRGLGGELPPTTSTASDLFGITRTIDTYQTGGAFYLIDASREMHTSAAAAASDFPEAPVSSIWTVNAQNTAPQNNDFAVTHVSSSNNNWNNPTAISAHYNAGKAYEYFENTFNRNSINGEGGNIVSLINVADEDGGDMDNAFWNGAAMFYGNGDVAFEPLAKGLDVAGHEMSHGVVQNTANLEYFGESGAMNESFADIFGAMIDREDWKIGEDVVNTSVFPTGTMRDMEDPHNGGNNFNDNGYQPSHVNEQFTGSGDNGGVHINSGIPNHAYYLFATEIGKDKAEQIFYRALTEYLVKSSQFIDLRIAVIQAATDLHGANSSEVSAAMNAFSAVGIGAGSGTTTQTDIETNSGDDYILMTDNNLDQLYIFTPNGDAIFNALTNVSPISKPSITDDGSSIVYVAADKTIQAITIDWATSDVNQFDLSTDAVWRNAVVSKDGSKVAAVTDDFDNRVWVFDLDNGGVGTTFDLVNPTTAQGGASTGDVDYADVLEFDFTGEWLMYDAKNTISSSFGTDIEYWDIGFVRVFDNEANDFGDGFISKLFGGLPENTSVGNPTFSKNSDFIIALDFLDEVADDYAILGANIETGDVGTIFEQNQLGYPNYSVQDDQIVFDAVTGFFEDPILAFRSVGTDKISGVGDATIFIENGKWGVWFADGERDLTNTNELVLDDNNFKIYPNPFVDNLKIEFENANLEEVQIEIFDVLGKRVFDKKMNASSETLDLNNLNSGSYLVRVSKDESAITARIVKF